MEISGDALQKQSNEYQYWSIFSNYLYNEITLCSKTTFIYVCFTLTVFTYLEVKFKLPQMLLLQYL